PNKQTKALTKSGNYMLEIYNDQDKLVFSKRFMVFEDLASVQARVKRSRDLNYINTEQVINFSITGGDRIIFRNPDRTLKTLIIKNNNLQNSIYDLKPQYHMGNKLVYRYDQPAAFNGGNEFLFFDSKDVRGSTMNIKQVELKRN